MAVPRALALGPRSGCAWGHCPRWRCGRRRCGWPAGCGEASGDNFCSCSRRRAQYIGGLGRWCRPAAPAANQAACPGACAGACARLGRRPGEICGRLLHGPAAHAARRARPGRTATADHRWPEPAGVAQPAWARPVRAATGPAAAGHHRPGPAMGGRAHAAAGPGAAGCAGHVLAHALRPMGSYRLLLQGGSGEARHRSLRCPRWMARAAAVGQRPVGGAAPEHRRGQRRAARARGGAGESSEHHRTAQRRRPSSPWGGTYAFLFPTPMAFLLFIR